MKDEVTIVTAFLNIGDFLREGQLRSAEGSYKHWMTIYSRIKNPVIAWFDNPDDAKYFKQIRSSSPNRRTIIYVINRNETWSFSTLQPKIKSIYDRPGYPKLNPNTVLPEYSCVMHAKYELMLRAVYNNHFNILYFAWLDIGLYRKLIDKEEGSKETFEIYIPPDMDQNKVAYNKVFNRSEDMTLENIMLTNQVWVCGCYFVARDSVMLYTVVPSSDCIAFSQK